MALSAAQNKVELDKLSAPFRWRVRAWMWLCYVTLGLTVYIVDGYRSAAEQLALHRADPRNPADPGDHGAGQAVDVNVWRDGKPVLLKGSPAAAWAPVYRLAALCGISNGSTFGAGTARAYPDNNHFYRRKKF